MVLVDVFLVLTLSLGLSGSLASARPMQDSVIYVVTNSNSTGAGSLRQAILDANGHPGKDYIYFDIPISDPGYSAEIGVWFIRLTTVLPMLEDNDGVEIYGETQDDSNPNLPGIIIEATSSIPLGADLISIISDHNIISHLGLLNSRGDSIYIERQSNTIVGNQIFTSPYYGINLESGANYNVIRDNHICGHSLGGMHLNYAYSNLIEDNLIGIQPLYIPSVPINAGNGISLSASSNNTIQKNTISANGGSGISLSPAGGNRIESNTIGLGEDLEEASGNGDYGIYVDGISNEIFNNWIAANARDGIRLEGSNTYNNKLEQNKIGISLLGPAPNLQHGIGIYNGAHDNKIGNSADANSSNMIAANGWSGVVVVDSPTGNNTIVFNYILYNKYYGVNIVNSPDNGIVNNIIVGNGTAGSYAGVQIKNTSGVADRSDRNQISYNRISGNSGKGIELLNDANANMVPPTIVSASCTSVIGTTTSACGTSCSVQIFSDNEDEGNILEGTVTTVAAGNFGWSGFPHGPNVTATVTDALGNTSEFSLAKVNACIRKYQYLPLIMK